MKTGRITGFNEGKIQFAPTYKRKPGTNDVISTKRNPSWTDRILFRSNPESCTLLQKSYDSNNLLVLSDHRPVFSQFLLTFKLNESEELAGAESDSKAGLLKEGGPS